MIMRIFTDGACSTNGTWAGGWGTAWVLFNNGKAVEGKSMTDHGGEDNTTNNRMELMAAIKGLERVMGMPNEVIELYSDSQYVVKGLNEWCAGWEKRG